MENLFALYGTQIVFVVAKQEFGRFFGRFGMSIRELEQLIGRSIADTQINRYYNLIRTRHADANKGMMESNQSNQLSPIELQKRHPIFEQSHI